MEYFPIDAPNQVRRIKIPNPKQRSLFVSNLQIGTLYAYRVMAVNKWGTSKPRTAEFKIKLESIDEDDRSGSIWFGPHSNMNSLVDIDQPQHYSQQQTIQVILPNLQTLYMFYF